MRALQSAPITVEIIDLTHDGQGVADLDGRKVFVPGTLPGEQAVIVARGKRRRYAEAELVEVVRASAQRVDPQCEYFGRCGGCSLQHLAYSAQLEIKQSAAQESLKRLAGVEAGRWLPPVSSEPWRYRRRARLGVKYVEAKGRVLVGFRERQAPLVMDMSHCPILLPPFDNALSDLAETLLGTSIRNRVPQAELAVGDASAAVVLRVLEEPTEADCDLLSAFGARLDADVYLQRGGPGTVSPLNPDGLRPLWYALPEFECRLYFEPTDFVQVNPSVNARMVASVIDQLGLTPGDRVLDLFCGIGNFSLPLARRAGEVLGVEGEAQLVARAVANAQRNGLTNTRFLAADLSQTGWQFLDQPWDVVVLDPPRTGAEAVVERMAAMRPRRLAYVSCHPGSLARDARILKSQGYALVQAQALDMFPHTHHVEVTALFERG
jgi:23S rRNA (uracil1939-C5)-methyltransferase